MPSVPGTGWNLVFDDEFTGSSLDTSKWTIGKAWSTPDTNRGDGLAYIEDSDVIVSNGTLKLRDEKRDVVGPQSHTVYHYTTGYIQTSAHFRAAYGYFEIRAQVPTNVGQGIWPAFWMLGNGWPPEMDIAEWITSGNNFHQGLYGMDSHWHDYHTFTPFPSGFHTYSMQWSPGQQIYYVDDQPRLTVNGSYVPLQSMYLILDNGINSTSPPNSGTVFPNDFVVDYVRVYQGSGGGQIVNPGFEAGSTGWSLSGSAAVANYNQRTGFGQLRLNGGTGDGEQVITGLTPNTTYTLSGWDRVSYSSAVARLGVKNYGGAETWADNGATGYTQEAVTFTTGPTSTQATVYCSKPVNGNAAEFDDLDLVKAATASALPDLTTNIGTPTGTAPLTLTGTAAPFAAVSAASGNPSLVPNQNLHLGGSGTQRTLTVTPAPGQVGTATITVTVTDPVWGGRTARSFVVNVVNPAVPAPWWNQDIGTVGFSGSASSPDGIAFTVQGSGADIWNQSDGFQYVYVPVTGDGSIIAHVASQDNTGGYAKAGVMIRETLDPGAKHALVDLTPSHGTEFIRRTTTGANAVSNFHTGTAVPYWVRLDRSGDTLTAYDSADGVSWNLVGSATVPMAPTVYAGLAVCAFNNAALNTATFDNVYLSWTHAPVDLSASFNQVGSVSDGTPFSGGLDGNGNAYSASLLGAPLMANGTLFTLGAPGTNAVQATGQTIALPAGPFSVLSFLGTGVNGPQPGQTFVVNYADGSSDTFTQDLSDWLSPQGYTGEAVAAALSYYDYQDGSSVAVPSYLYQYSFALNNQKTVSSITLPANGNVVMLAMDLSLGGTGSQPDIAAPAGGMFRAGVTPRVPSADVLVIPGSGAASPGRGTPDGQPANVNGTGQTDLNQAATDPAGVTPTASTPHQRVETLDLVLTDWGSGLALAERE